MPRKRYKFNPQTFTYEIITIPFRIKFYRFLRSVLIAFIMASVITVLFSYFFYTPKMYRISQQRNELLIKYDLLNEKIAGSLEQITEITVREKYVYRNLFAIDTLGIEGIYTPYPESKYSYFSGDRYAPLIRATWNGLDALSRLTYAGSVALDELEPMAADKEKMAESIPAILPLDKNNLKRTSSLFGYRRDPVSGRSGALHQGMDFTGERGTPIYSTGNGVVIDVERKATGYGRQVLVDHGYGYRTRYAHLNKIDVIVGQIVKRGEKIGEMGNTGKSVGTHLHYEVHYRGRPVDPISYFSLDMSNEDYATILENATAGPME